MFSFCADEELLIFDGNRMSDYVFSVFVTEVKVKLILGLEIEEQP